MWREYRRSDGGRHDEHRDHSVDPHIETLEKVSIGLALLGSTGAALAQTVPVTADNFRRAETDRYFASDIKLAGGIGRIHHNRAVVPIDCQTVIRTNRDTLYSTAVFDHPLAIAPNEQ